MILPFGEDTSPHRRSTKPLRCWRRSEGRGEWPDIPVDPPKRSGRPRPTLRCALARQTSGSTLLQKRDSIMQFWPALWPSQCPPPFTNAGPDAPDSTASVQHADAAARCTAEPQIHSKR
eukprot:scaffold20617_cov53-Phaeocystis_antarctica.AAC.2